MKIAILSNAVCEVLARMMRPRFDVWTPPGFAAWAETAFDPPRELADSPPDVFVFALDPACGAVDPALREKAKSAVAAAFPLAEILDVDIAALREETGPGFHDMRMLAAAAMPWSLAGLRALRAEIENFAHLVEGGAKKAVAVDFDGTLWDGVLAEDGMDGISHRLEFQRALLALKKRGVLLVALSKNTPETAEAAWRDPRMALKREDFADIRLGWGGKAENLAAAAKTLNISPDAFVFIDDNPGERERMKALSPGTAVPDFPRDPADLPRFAAMLERRYFPRLRRAAGGVDRTAQRRAEALRAKIASGMQAEEYLRSLELRVDAHPAIAGEFLRIADLCARSNQFNVLTVRHTAREIAAMAQDPERLALSVCAADRFGDYGLIAFVSARVDSAERSARIEDFVMSCRAMNRRIEFAAQEALEAALAARGVAKIFARRDRTAKNAPVENLFDSFGFARVREEGGSAFYELDLPRAPANRPVHYAVMRPQ